MAKNQQDRELVIRFEGEDLLDHSISLKLLTRFFDSMQNLLVHLTEAQLGRLPSRDNWTSSRVADTCALYLKDLTHNCVTARLYVPERTVPLFPALPELEEQVIADAKKSVSWYGQSMAKPFIDLCPSESNRAQVLKDLYQLSPAEKDQHRVFLTGLDGEQSDLPIRRPREYKEFLSAALSTKVIALEEPVLVEAKGLAIRRGNRLFWKEMYEIQELDLEHIWRPSEISWEGRILRLPHPLFVELEEQDGSIYASSGGLGICAAGVTEDDAKLAFAEEFIVLWEEIALAPDEELTSDAIELKRKMLELVGDGR